MTDYNGAIWIPNNNFFPNRNGYKPSYIVLHGTAGGLSAQAVAEYFASTQGTANPVSATYVADQQGVVVQCNSESDGAYSNGFISGSTGVSGDGVGNGFHDSWWDSGINPNLLTISIEHVKSTTDNSNQLTDAQKLASFKLIRDICQRRNIPMRRADASGGITGHYAIDPVNRAECPGPYPWNDLWAYLKGEDTTVLDISHTSGYFIDTGSTPNTRWHCKQTGYDVALGILDYYRTCTQTGLNGLSQFGLPLTGEQAVQGYKSVVAQKFERGIIAFDPQKEMDSVPGLSGPCYPAHIQYVTDTTPNNAAAIADIKTIQAAIGSVLTKLGG